MKVAPVIKRKTWESFRRDRPDFHGYAYNYRWISFQAEWMKGDPVRLGLWEEERLIDIFAGIKIGRRLYAGPNMSPGGCSTPLHLKYFLDYLPNLKVYLTTVFKPACRSDHHFDMIIDLKQVASTDHYGRRIVHKNARRKINTAKKHGFDIQTGRVGDFMDCYNEMCLRNKVKSPFSESYFQHMKQHLKDEMMIKVFVLKDELMGASLMISTPGHLHAYYLISMRKAFKAGLSDFIYVDFVSEAMARGKRYANCGPSSPWDGAFVFKKRMGAQPSSLFTMQIRTSVLEQCVFHLKRVIKAYKLNRYPGVMF